MRNRRCFPTSALICLTFIQHRKNLWKWDLPTTFFILLASLALMLPFDGRADTVLLDQAWAGSNPLFDALSDGRHSYIAYYDGDRNVPLADYDQATGKVMKKSLSSQFGGWDAHNYLSLSFDAQGRVHLAGN